MVRKSTRGAVSLLSVFCLVGVVTLLAAGMVSVFTLNLNMTQKSFNGSIAEAEAEAGIAELLYRISDEENVDNEKQPPTVSYGRASETIRSTITPGLGAQEAFHLVTFNPGSEYPHSTNNTYLDRGTGALGRTVPDGMFHVISTGYCRGQYRTIEALVSKPPFPFGLATSGKLASHDPFVVKGVSSVAELLEDKEDRPGHILCNSPEGVSIGQSDPPRPTYISGFVKSVGPISIEQPAQVLGGIRPGADPSTLAKIDVTKFHNEGDPGVVTINAPSLVRDQSMDIMYFFSGPRLTYEGSVKLNKAFLYVEGDLVIKGPVTGEGLIVVDGDVIFGSGTSLSGANKMAVLASGDVTIKGNNNYFTGLIYCGGDFTASNVTVVGNTIVNSDDPEKGNAILENVTVIGNSETADMTITITSSTQAKGQNNESDGVIPLQLNSHNGKDVFGLPADFDYSDNGGGKLDGWVSSDVGQSTFVDDGLMVLYQRASMITQEFPVLGNGPTSGSAAEVWGQAQALYEKALGNRTIHIEIARLEALKTMSDKMGEPTAPFDSEIASWRLQLTSEEEFRLEAISLYQAVLEHKQSHADGDGVYDDGTTSMDISLEHRFNLNEYLPESERLKIAYWRVHHRRL